MNKQLITTLLIAVFCAGAAFAGSHKNGPSGSHGQDIAERLAQKLNMSEQQKQAYQALLDEYKPRLEEISERGKTDREALGQMAPDDPEFAAQVEAVSSNASTAAAEMVKVRAELQTKVYALLDETQQAEYLALRSERQDRRQARRNKFR
ncbi:MAG: Spy/CpxP family protein refolding chaperone [Gammaproteobacteria bacterium]